MQPRELRPRGLVEDELPLVGQHVMCALNRRRREEIAYRLPCLSSGLSDEFVVCHAEAKVQTRVLGRS